MIEKIIQVPSVSEYHTDGITESTHINVSGPLEDKIYISEFHSDSTNVTFIGEFSVEEDSIDENKSPIFDQIIDKKKILNYQIFVYNNEGPIPHFHVIDLSGNNRYKDVCICIYSANYFSHGKHNDILNNKELKILDNFLRVSMGEKITNWDYISFVWKNNNPEMVKKYPNFYKTIQPNYTNISTFVENPKYY